DELALPAFLFELHNARYHREQRVIRTAPDIRAGLELRASLTNQNLATQHSLTAESLYAEPLRVRIPTVARTSNAFLLSHSSSSSKPILSPPDPEPVQQTFNPMDAVNVPRTLGRIRQSPRHPRLTERAPTRQPLCYRLPPSRSRFRQANRF